MYINFTQIYFNWYLSFNKTINEINCDHDTNSIFLFPTKSRSRTSGL